MKRTCTMSFLNSMELRKRLLRMFREPDPLQAAIICVALPSNPSGLLHPLQDTGQRRWLDQHPAAELRLYQAVLGQQTVE